MSKDTWLTGEGNTSGKGPLRFTRYDDFQKLLTENRYIIESIEMIKESNSNRSNWTMEWIVEAKK